MSNQAQKQYGQQFSSEVQNVIRLTLSFAKAVGDNQDDKNDNLVVSPYNYIRFLSMLSKGTDGDTKEELGQVLFGVGKDEIDAEIDKLLQLNTDILDANKGNVTLSTATGVWANTDQTELNSDFADELEKLFETRVSSDSFSADPAATLTDINGWASSSTNGLITKIVDDLDPSMVAILASALYFKGDWTSKFDKDLTEEKAFAADGGAKALTQMMHQNLSKDDVTYNEGDDYEAVSMTYGERDRQNGKYPSMRIVLVRPKDEGQSARDWMADQADGTVPAWLDPFAYEQATGVVELPHIDITQEHNLKPALADAGLTRTLSPSADFSKMTADGARDLELDVVKEDIVFKTNEEGSEAASIVTGIIRATSIQLPPRNIHVEFNRSFVLAVQDIQTGAVLFTGAVNKPNEAMTPAP